MLVRCALLILACIGILPGQSIDAYVSFLGQVARLGRGGTTVLLNGQPSNLIAPRLQDEVGLTTEEADAVSAVAKDLQSKLADIDLAFRGVIWEQRLAAIAGEAPTRTEADLQAQITRQRTQSAADKVLELETRLGEARFQVIRDFINSHSGKQFFPLRPGDPPEPK